MKTIKGIKYFLDKNMVLTFTINVEGQEEPEIRKFTIPDNYGFVYKYVLKGKKDCRPRVVCNYVAGPKVKLELDGFEVEEDTNVRVNWSKGLLTNQKELDWLPQNYFK